MAALLLVAWPAGLFLVAVVAAWDKLNHKFKCFVNRWFKFVAK
jgi:hypothetical protein